MTIILSHQTAFLFWRHFAGNMRTLRPTAPMQSGNERPRLTADLLRELAALGVNATQRTPHLLVTKDTLRSRSANCYVHLAEHPLPPAAVLQISANVGVVAPELCFVQMARVASPERLALIGCELCGTYAQDEDGKLIERAPLTTAERLLNFANLVPGAAGCVTARRIAPHVFNGAASPMEAKLALLLCLPNTLGGYGLPCPELNPTVTLSAEARSLYHVAACRPDLFWADPRVDMEYDGGAHEGEASRTKDAGRVSALRAEGIDVTALTYPQVADVAAFDTVARTLAKNLGWRLRIRVANFPARRARLREELGLAQASRTKESCSTV